MRLIIAALLLAGAAQAADLPRPVADADFPPVRLDEARLGQRLFWDKVLSGNRTISCGTCHHPAFGGGDGVALGLGDGGTGLGPDRVADPANRPERRMARNAPALWNLGAAGFTALFHDGRIEADPAHPAGLRTPLADLAVAKFASLLAVQAMFPVLSADEMAGHRTENAIAAAVRQGRIAGPGGALDRVAARVAAIPEYRARFAAAYPHVAAGAPIRFADIANAIAAFVAFEFRADDSPFDRHLRDGAPLPPAAAAGMALFYGAAGCAACHTGPFQTDMGFHAMGSPQIGPGLAAPFETHQRDTGRMRVTGRAEDAYAFRTPSLRMVTQTGPWGHAGAHDDLAAFLRHHTDPAAGLAAWQPAARLPAFDPAQPDFALMAAPWEVAQIAAAVRRPPVTLAPDDIAALIAFLDSLTDARALQGRLGIPATVPSGLPVDVGPSRPLDTVGDNG